MTTAEFAFTNAQTGGGRNPELSIVRRRDLEQLLRIAGKLVGDAKRVESAENDD